MVGLFCIANMLEVAKKDIFKKSLWILTPSKPK